MAVRSQICRYASEYGYQAFPTPETFELVMLCTNNYCHYTVRCWPTLFFNRPQAGTRIGLGNQAWCITDNAILTARLKSRTWLTWIYHCLRTTGQRRVSRTCWSWIELAKRCLWRPRRSCTDDWKDILMKKLAKEITWELCTGSWMIFGLEPPGLLWVCFNGTKIVQIYNFTSNTSLLSVLDRMERSLEAFTLLREEFLRSSTGISILNVRFRSKLSSWNWNRVRPSHWLQRSSDCTSFPYR